MSDIEQAKEATEKAKAKVELAAADMLQLYLNLLSIDAKYVWNKIVHKQTQSDPYTDLQGCSKKGPRGYMRKSFDNCMIFHLVTVFPNNAAETLGDPYAKKSPSHYHVLGPPLICLSPQAFLATKYLASLAYSIG